MKPYIPPILSDEQKESVEEDLKLLSSKDIYPYEYMDSPDKEAAIPDITEKEHQHAKHEFEHFGGSTLQDYHAMVTDVLIEFRRVCLETYNLYPMHYYTAPGLTWDAGLKFTDETLQLLTENDKFCSLKLV